MAFSLILKNNGHLENILGLIKLLVIVVVVKCLKIAYLM